MHLEVIQPTITPSVHLMNFQFLTSHGDNFRIPLLQPHKLWDNSKFNRNWNTTLVVTGWNSNVNSTNEAVQTLFNAYRERNINFIVSGILLFESLEQFQNDQKFCNIYIYLVIYSSIVQVFDTSNFVDSLYTWSAFNTEGVGKIVGGAVAELSKVVDVDGIHLIGNKTQLKMSFHYIYNMRNY